MELCQSETELQQRLGLPVEAATPRRALEAMSTFYAEQQAEEVAIDEDGDMLLYEWGVYSFTGPEAFQFGLTRQFLITDEDEPYQLHLTLHFPPTDALRQLGSGSEWCRSPEELPAFRQAVQASAPFEALADTRPSRVELYSEQG